MFTKFYQNFQFFFRRIKLYLKEEHPLKSYAVSLSVVSNIKNENFQQLKVFINVCLINEKNHFRIQYFQSNILEVIQIISNGITGKNIFELR